MERKQSFELSQVAIRPCLAALQFSISRRCPCTPDSRAHRTRASMRGFRGKLREK